MSEDDANVIKDQSGIDQESGSPDFGQEPTDVKVDIPEIPEDMAPAPSKFRRLLRTVLQWTLGLLGVFALGAGVTWVSLIRPLRAENQSLLEDIDSIQAESISEKDSLKALHQAEVQDLDNHINLVNALVEVYTARVALNQEDIVGVRASLAGTDDRLRMLQTELENDGTAAVKALREQLASALNALDDDTIEVNLELARLVENLKALERSVFIE